MGLDRQEFRHWEPLRDGSAQHGKNSPPSAVVSEELSSAEIHSSLSKLMECYQSLAVHKVLLRVSFVTVLLLGIELVVIGMMKVRGDTIDPLQHVFISIKLLSLVSKGYCLCTSFTVRVAVFKYSLVIFDLFSFG